MSRRFGGVSTDNVNVVHHAAIDALSEVSVFIRSFRTGDGGNNLGRYASKAQGSNNDWQVYNNLSSSATNFDVTRWGTTAGQWQIPAVAISDWHSLCFTYSYSSTANNPKGYIDTVSQTVTRLTAPSGTLGAATSDVCVGNNAASGGVRVFAGDLADFAIWNRILSPGEVSIVHYLGPARVANGLVLYLPLDGNDSPEPNRATGTGALKNGTVTGTTKGRLLFGASTDRSRISRFAS